jgi:hypothetical protein
MMVIYTHGGLMSNRSGGALENYGCVEEIGCMKLALTSALCLLAVGAGVGTRANTV